MSILSINENDDFVTGATIVHNIRWTMTDYRYNNKLKKSGAPDPLDENYMIASIMSQLEQISFDRVLLTIEWERILNGLINLKYTRKRNTGFRLDFRLNKVSRTIYAQNHQGPDLYYLLIRVFRTAQSGQIYETVNMKVTFRPEFNEMILKFSNDIVNTSKQL